MFVVLVLGLTTTFASEDIADGLVGYWPLDEGGGITTSDRSGNGNDGTLNAPTWDSGKFGGALNFDGSDDYVDCGNPPILDFGTGDWTISAWIKLPVNPGTNTVIFSKGGDNDGGIRYAMELEDGSGGVIEPTLDDNSTKLNPDGDITVIDGQWHHFVVMRKDGTKLRLYVDGVEDPGVTNHGESTIAANYDLSGTSQHNAYIGAVMSNESGQLQKFFGGLIDDVALWNRALNPEEISYLWNNGDGNSVAVSDPGQASDPYPADEETDVLRDVALSWEPGEFAAPTNGHKVYFGENFNDVNDATGGDAQSAASYAPPRLDLGTTYYWRVDEVNPPPDSTVYRGSVWSFTTEPIAYPIENITTTASSTGQEGMDPENTINGSGLDVNDLHSTEPTDMWLSGSEPNTWIEYELDKVYKLHEMWVWNQNGLMEPMIGIGFKDVSIEYSVDGTDYTTLGTTHEFARAPGLDNYAHNTTVDFGGAAAKYIRLTVNSNWGGFMPQYGLSEVRFFSIPVFAREPSPDSEATDVDVDVVLGFRAGREADTHDVYLSSDEQAVSDGNVPVSTVTETSHGPLSLELGTTYYWKINEVNEAETPTTWQGEIWHFSTPEFFVVDDFEDYNDYPPDEIFSTWIDGYGIATNGSTAGYAEPDFLAGEHYVETTNVYGGDQSMPFFYDNTGAAAYSEAERTFAVPQDWTKAGIQTLVLYFHGTPGNTGQLYVKVNGSKVVYDGDVADIAKPRWKQWSIDLASLGVNLQSVTTLGIGIDGSGAGGTLYLDDIRLYRLAPELPLEIWFEAEAADTITPPMQVYDDPLASGGRYIGTDDGIGDEDDNPPADGIATYSFTVEAGTYKILGRVRPDAGNSFWVRIATVTPVPVTRTDGWIKWNSIEEGAEWHWDEVHDEDQSGNPRVEWTLPAGQHTLEIARREDGGLLDAILITDKLD